MARPREEAFTATRGSLPGPASGPAPSGAAAWPEYSAVTPSSLKREAMVPYTGMASGACANDSWLR